VANSTDTERMTGMPVGTPPVLGIPRDMRTDADEPRVVGAEVPAQRVGTESESGSAGLISDLGGTDVERPVAGGVGVDLPQAADGQPTAAAFPRADSRSESGTPRVVSVADLGAKATSAAFDPQAPQPLPERIRPLVGALMANAGRIGLKLTLSCGRRVSVACAGCGRLPASALATAGAAWSMVDAGLPTPGVLTADDPVALALADLLLGGSGTVTDRAPERVEASVLRRHLGRALSPLAEPLQPYGVSALVLAEPPPETTPTELLGGAEMFAVRLTVELDSGTLPGALVLALPYRTLFGTAGTADVPRDEAANRALAGVPVDLTVRFPATTLPAYDVAGLEPGDVLRLEVAQPVVQGMVDGVHLLSGSLGRSGRRRAILVSSLTPEWGEEQ
jgi:hypothetical protein